MIVFDSTAEDVAQGARFRTVLAHTYGDIIDHDVVYNALPALERYRQLVVEISDYLDSIDALDE